MDPRITFTAGAIYSEQAYALGKMLDHSGWNGALVRGITPSDLDTFYDNNGMIMMCELSSSACEWRDLRKGQQWAYESFIKGTAHCAVMCKHNITPDSGRQINTRTDIESFQVKVWDHEFVYSNVVIGNGFWQRFVLSWCNKARGPIHIRRSILSADLQKRQQPVIKPNVIPITAAAAMRKAMDEA